MVTIEIIFVQDFHMLLHKIKFMENSLDLLALLRSISQTWTCKLEQVFITIN